MGQIENTHGFNPEKTSIRLTTVYPLSNFGGVQTVVRNLAEDYRDLGFDASAHGTNNRLLGIKGNGTYPHGLYVPLSIFGTTSNIAIPDFRPNRDITNATIAHGHESMLNAQDLLLFMLRSKTHPNRKNMLNIGTLHAMNKAGSDYLDTFSPAVYLFDRMQIMDGITAVSEPLRQTTLAAFPLLENTEIEVVPNAVDTSELSPDVPRLKEFDDGKVNILYLGRLEDRKGVDILIKAYSKVRKKHAETRLIIAGDGFQREELEELTRNLGLENDVHFLGRVDEEIKPNVYSTGDIFVPLSTKNESFGITLIEAMAAGLPVVAANNEGYKSLIKQTDEGRNGFVVDPNDIRAVADLLCELVEDKPLRKSIGEYGRKLALSFDRKVIAQRYLDVYWRAWERKQARKNTEVVLEKDEPSFLSLIKSVKSMIPRL